MIEQAFRVRDVRGLWVVRRGLQTGLAAATCATVVAGCGGSAPLYVKLQNAIARTETTKDRRPVASVACSPQIKNIDRGDIVNLVCRVRFKDGTSYQANATVTHPFRYSGSVGYYHYTWDSPPPTDLTRTPLPRPAIAVPPASPDSLFYARNLRPIVSTLRSRFSGQLILQMALYPGELDAVIGGSGSAELVRAQRPDTLTVGPHSSFEGPRSGISLSQLDPAVPERLVHEIATRAAEPTSRLDRFVLASFRGDLAGWIIYPSSGQTRFQAYLQGDSLKQISPGDTRKLT